LTRWYREPQPVPTSRGRLIATALLLATPFGLLTWVLTAPDPNPVAPAPESVAPELSPTAQAAPMPTPAGTAGVVPAPALAVIVTPTPKPKESTEPRKASKTAHTTGRHRRPRQAPLLTVCVREHGKASRAPVCYSLVSE
jgi:hypothetical protein